MREFSEKELELKYKDEKLMEIPDLWENIERNLAPKNIKPECEQKKTSNKVVEVRSRKKADTKGISVRKIASIAAAVAVVILLGPTVYVIQQAKGGATADCAGSAMEEIAFSAGTEAEEMEGAYFETPMEQSEESGIAVNSEEMVADSEEATGIQSEEAGIPSKETELESVPTERGDFSELSVEILSVEETEDELLLLVEVLENSGVYQTGSQLEIICRQDDTDYEIADFSGEMRLQVQEVEKKIKLLKILP